MQQTVANNIQSAFIASLKLPPVIKPVIGHSLSQLMALPKLDEMYEASRNAHGIHFSAKILKAFATGYSVTDQELARIPSSGPLIIVANHPFGGIEGIILADLLMRVRSDIKIMANYFLKAVHELNDLFIFVDPFGKSASISRNIQPIKQALRWVTNGGVLVIFPSGEVSHLSDLHAGVTDPAWQENIGRLIEKAAAPVQPVFFEGRNGNYFQLLGLLHPGLRTMRLPGEMLKKRHTTIPVRIGNVIKPSQLNQFPDAQAKINYLRRRTYLLGQRPDPAVNHPTILSDFKEAVAELQPAEVLASEYRQIPADQQLAASGNFTVFYASAPQIPSILEEIGRLREITFREVQEGTGKSRDLDEYDRYYLHLIVWDTEAGKIVGAYRLGLSDVILKKFGRKGLYTSTLFKMKKKFLHTVYPAIELGRSFVTPEYQRNYNSLLMLWRGIGEFCVRNPQYRYLIGPVSISNGYSKTAQKILISFLWQAHRDRFNGQLVKPVNKKSDHYRRKLPYDVQVQSLEEVEELMRELEGQFDGIPVLIRQYLKVGAKFLAFNRDPKFNNAIDGLIVVDLLATEEKIINRYFGVAGKKSYYEYWTQNQTIY
jgi:putative hemolysin